MLVNPFPNKPWFLRVCKYRSFENTERKGEIARNEQFLLFPQCFLPIWITFCLFYRIKLVVYKLFQFGRVSNLSFGKGLKGPQGNCWASLVILPVLAFAQTLDHKIQSSIVYSCFFLGIKIVL